ncbi:phosphate signaling complex protein PhoU [Phenylobacterium sp.]|uniref:phosphate signaling complex protein PhoU n=1 Tax=Phenylobacterium sp. TaxID=1871053 RepID=UPI003BAC24DB
MEHTVRAYDEELDRLKDSIVEMGRLATVALAQALAAIAGREVLLANGVIEADRRIDALEADIEQGAISLIARRQPLAGDLRRTLAAMKIAGNLERCGDLAKSIAKRSLLLGDGSIESLMRSLERMGEMAAARLTQVMEAYRDGALDQAIEVWTRDQDIDAYYETVFRELLTHMMGDPRLIAPCSHLLFVAKNLERIGDHATNIAEVVHYQITGDPMPGTDRPKWDALEER